MPGFLEFIDDLPIVAHNAEFDMGFLREKLPRINLEIPTNLIWDNLKLGVLLYPDFSSYGLESLATTFNIPFAKSHRASEDCVVTGQIFIRFLENAPSLIDRDLLKVLVGEYLQDDPLSKPLRRIIEHPEFDKYAEKSHSPVFTEHFNTGVKEVFRDRGFNREADLLIRLSADDEKSPQAIFRDPNLYDKGVRHYFTFPSTQYPGDFWGVEKKWNSIFDNSKDLELYPGAERLLCRQQMKIFVEEKASDRLGLTGFEIAVLTSFASSNKMGNFSRLSWWIWNNLTNLAAAIPFLNASNCVPDNCLFRDNCFYLDALERAGKSRMLGFPYRVIKEENKIPGSAEQTRNSDLTFLIPETIFKDNLCAGIQSFALTHNVVLMEKAIRFAPDEMVQPLFDILNDAKHLLTETNDLVDDIMAAEGKNRLQKGKRFFLFVEDEITFKSAELIDKLKRLNSFSHDFLKITENQTNESVGVIANMLKNAYERFQDAIAQMQDNRLVLCLDKIEKGSSDTCRFLFFPHIYNENFLKLPEDVARINYLTHHISSASDWEKYFKLLGRDRRTVDFHDISEKIPQGNQIYIVPPDTGDKQVSKKKIMEIKGNVITRILERFPGRSIVIVRGSQELLNFKYRLSPKLKEAGYWPLFQKQDGPKGLLIKEFSKHQNVVFFGLSDLVSDIWQFLNPPDNLIFESLHLTSLQDPIEAFIKREIENTGGDYINEYLEPKIHFTLSGSLKRWKNFLEGRGYMFILDETLATSDSGLSFLNQLEGEKSYLKDV